MTTQDHEDDGTVQLDKDEVDEALEELEEAMQAGETALSHDEIRPTTSIMANKARDAYRILVKAHPGYDLTEADDE